MRKVMALLPAPPAGPPSGVAAYGLDVELDGGRAMLSLWLDDDQPLPDLPPGSSAWAVDERVQWDQRGSVPGVKQISFVVRLPSLTRDEFASYWAERHAPLARVHHPGLVRYAQNVVQERLVGNGPEIDGLAELSFRSVEERKSRFYDSDDGRARIAEDVRRFVDLSGGGRVVAREHVLGGVAAIDGGPVPIPSATVVLGRDGPAGFEVLLLQRHSRLEFAGDMWVFPGGRIDPGDADPEWPGDTTAAARRAAIREAAEETGLDVSADDLVWFAHWTAPPQSPKRFATWFFLAPAPAGSVAIDGGEIVDHRWVTPGDALAARDAGEIELSPPTFITLFHLARFNELDQAVAQLGASTPEYFATRFAPVPNGAVALYAGDAAYDDLDADRPGGRHRLWMMKDGWRYERS